MTRANDIRDLISNLADRLDSTLDTESGIDELLVRITIMEARDSLRKYDGLHNVVRIRKTVERLPHELRAAGFEDELLRPIVAVCERVVRVLRRV